MKKAILMRLNSTLDFLKNAELEKAYSELEESLNDDLENVDVEYALKGVQYWLERLAIAKKGSTPFEKGEYMISQWKPFLAYMDKQGNLREDIIYALRRAVFLISLEFYSKLFEEDANIKEADSYRKVGLCYKMVGEYDKALEFLQYAYELKKNSAAIIAELADCYACYGEIKFSKVYFREAFFVGASDIEIQFLESELISRLIKRVKEFGVSDEYILEWIPIYGMLDGVFNVKRELKSLEYGKLKQKIFLLECEVEEKTGDQKGKLVPRLINSYFWLIDHYVACHEEKSKIDSILLKIRVLDRNIYESYTR